MNDIKNAREFAQLKNEVSFQIKRVNEAERRVSRAKDVYARRARDPRIGSALVREAENNYNREADLLKREQEKLRNIQRKLDRLL